MNHKWKFFRAGGFDQVKLESGADLANLDQLDQKLWVALACPTTGLEFDAKTLALMDTDNDGCIRAPELIAAVKWTASLLKNSDDLLKGSASLPLAAINNATPEGKQLFSSAKHILANLGKKDEAIINLDDVGDTVKIFATTNFNGDGIIPADAAEDDATKTVVADIITCFGAETDRSGKPGINQAKTDQFFTDAQAYSDWRKKAEGSSEILPLGETTSAAFAAVQAAKTKVDDFFARCRLAAFDERAIAALNHQESEFLTLAAKDLMVTAPEIAAFPLAKIEAGKSLPLKNGVNPAWADSLSTLQTAAVKPLLGDKTELTETDWNLLNVKLAPFAAWLSAKAGASVEKFGLDRIREILASGAKEKIAVLIAQDKALEPEANAMAGVEQLIRYHRDLYLLCKNFVNFKDFYDGGEMAIFQVGKLYLDQRCCSLTLPVNDAARHAKMAGLAGAYLAYCDCARKDSNEKLQIVAAFTDGDSENLMVGRNGVFYDRKGHDWIATITKLIDNPISIRQAFWLPYKKLVRMIEEHVAKRAAAADAASTAKLQNAAETAHAGAPKKMDLGTVALLTTAFTAIAGIITVILGKLTHLFTLGWLVIPALIGVFIAIVLLISGPSMILAYMKLRKRNVAPIFDANGWAVNTRAKINVPFGKSLTEVAKLPPGAQRDLHDPYASKKFPWKSLLILIVLGVLALCWWRGVLDTHLPKSIQSTTVLGTNAPAWRSPTNVAPKVGEK